MSNDEARFTWTLHDLVENEGVELFNFEYDLPDFVDKQKLELKFYKYYYFREIGSETIERFLLELQFKWEELAYKYYDLFELYHDKYLSPDALKNKNLTTIISNVFSDTPQSKLDSLSDYATSKTVTSSNVDGSDGEYLYKIISDYADKLRHIEYDMITECDDLFMQIF